MENVVRKASSTEPALVLVVDDETAICDTLTGVLRDEGFETITAHDGEQALRTVSVSAPAVVFLDIWMPGIDGIETLERIKAISPGTEVIMMSGHATIPTALEATKRGALDFIEKPFTIESILLATSRALERREGRVLREGRQNGKNQERELFRHPAILSRSCAGRNLGQRTLRQSAILYGQCLHSGQKSGLILEPLPPNSGLHFARIGHTESVPAFVRYVQSTGFATTLRSGPVVAATIEHLLAALHCYGVSNLLIKSNGEIPIFDGSAKEFCAVIESIGIEEQDAEWYEVVVDEPIRFAAGDGSTEEITLEPSDQLIVSYELHYPPPIGRQSYEFRFDGIESFKREIASARTFGFMKDIERLQRAGLAAGGRLDNFILIGPDKVLNTELRFPEELARHKVLDILGDLFLIGRPLRAHVKAKMTGHSDNVAVLKLLASRLTDTIF